MWRHRVNACAERVDPLNGVDQRVGERGSLEPLRVNDTPLEAPLQQRTQPGAVKRGGTNPGP